MSSPTAARLAAGLVMALCLGSPPRPAAAQVDLNALQRITEQAKIVCLIGDQYRFSADLSGNIVITSLRPGGQGHAVIDSRTAPGATGVIDEQLRVIADKDIRECMRGFVVQILQMNQETGRQRSGDVCAAGSVVAGRDISGSTITNTGSGATANCPERR